MIRWLIVMAVSVGALAFAVPILERFAGGLRGAGSGGEPVRGVHSILDGSPPAAGRAGGGTSTLYRWRDAKGTLHVESAPPPDGVPAETIRVQRAAPAPAVPASVVPARGLAENPLSVYTPAGRDALLQRIEETVQTLDERRRQAHSLEKQL